ncbi:Dihydrolipoyllysine-residue succinyltransferase component of 2-oxoglutarate dehydrogenase complex [Candidatus Megaera venefica]|uniref:Dihydrolipoyllysine-residue succinyltransferase component of 2-oxoglutarate dehydrogenase complex n=1 Tax=Candidatus Megaera venefica TaxID=2055910 RepID=A0ABU5NCI9_9RICK|nr:2-oxoglutarate dehydrogenase complex dihydrolipoyllysine-residue succinyltransferase [Candidatus Megaera venefica]MEA0970885.1 Dihydrolipoyllysine-residue succinyltransferase component of 2-oxoglutarate dehydrogenase complex [Candidatus Megaera venefica]
MSVQIVVPALGESVSEATIAKWYKKPGDAVKVDELLLELETEKVTLEVSASAEGILESIDKKEDEIVTVGQVVGTIKAGSIAAESKSTPMQPAPVTTASSMPVIQAVPVSNKQVDVTSTMPPSVQKLVTENNLNPTNITGTGKDGRINKGDVLNVLNNAVAPLNSTGLPQINSNEKPVERVRMSRLRKTIAQRLKDSQNTAAILSTFNEIDMSKVIALRTRYKDSFQEKHGVKLGFMSFFVKAVINALKEVPSVNAEMEGDDIIYKHYYDIGVAVGTEQGLVVPVVRNADRMNFSEIEKGIVSLAVKARDGKLSMSDLTGGTFSITNGGVYGSLLSTPIINPPQTGIIGLHNTQERPVAINGKVEIRPMMYIALSYDHRVIDGKDAVTFLVKVKQAIEDPERLLLDL